MQTDNFKYFMLQSAKEEMCHLVLTPRIVKKEEKNEKVVVQIEMSEEEKATQFLAAVNLKWRRKLLQVLWSSCLHHTHFLTCQKYDFINAFYELIVFFVLQSSILCI